MTKLANLLPGLCLFAMAACNKYKAEEFAVPKPPKVAEQEAIDSFPALKTFINHTAHPDFKLGVALSLNDYNSRGVMYRLANTNFEEIVAGYEMKHGAIVQADGTLSLEKVSQFINTAKAASMSVYGHTLAWHSNQNATYLNNIISPLIATIPAFANDLNTTAPKSGNLTGWNPASPGSGITVQTNMGMVANTNAIKLVSGANATVATSLQLITPSINVVAGHKYEVLCYIKSDVPGQGRIAFEGLSNNTPQQDWTGSGTKAESFTTGISWKAVKAQISDFTGNTIKLHLDLGYKPNVTYYIDVNTLYVYDTQGPAAVTNLVNGGDFETGPAWGGWGGSSTRGITASGLGYGGAGKAFFVTNPTTTPNFYDVQTIYQLDNNLTNGTVYTLSFWVKGTAAGIIRPELQSANFTSNGFGQVPVTTNWQLIEVSTTVTAADRNRIIFSYGEFAGTVYIDNVVLKSATAGGGTLVVPKTAAEKNSIITDAMDTWVKGLMNACKGHVKAWDVVNEPMDDANPNNLKTGVGRTVPADEFYWQDYMGTDYAVKAFQLAAQYGNSGDKLFINDYNLEYNLDKCRGLITYVNYIQSKGGRVDGIGTQMHIDINSDTSKIASMFSLLAATGKMIKISELDIGLGGATTTTATPAHYERQAKMYKYVIDKYFALIPAAQRYGITIWSPIDSPAGSSWRPNDPIGLWTTGYVRKLAYAYVAEALRANAGK